MKLTKKVLVGLVVLALMASMALSAFAAAPALAIKVGEPNDKGEVKVDVILKNAAGLQSGGFYLEFDADAYTFVKSAAGVDARNSATNVVTDLVPGTSTVTA
ncbi:MAG TPA: hypothetical protein PLU77_07160, partial [Clostridiales bacterium]|nr:hypothetical protein [Clostridiales bacterium]